MITGTNNDTSSVISNMVSVPIWEHGVTHEECLLSKSVPSAMPFETSQFECVAFLSYGAVPGRHGHLVQKKLV